MNEEENLDMVVAKVKFPCSVDLFTGIVGAVIANPPFGMSKDDIVVGKTDADGFTPIIARKRNGNEDGIVKEESDDGRES